MAVARNACASFIAGYLASTVTRAGKHSVELAADHRFDELTRPSAPVPDADSTTNFAAKRREMTGPYRARNPILLGALYTTNALASLLPARQKESAENRLLRVLKNWGHLGDVVTILPLLKFLEGHPRVEELGVLIESWSRAVVESSDIMARIHVIDHWTLDRSNKSIISKFLKYLSRYRDAVHELRECRYDMSIDTLASFPSSHGVTWSASIPRRVGFTSGGLGSCLTDPFDWTPDDRFMLDHQLELLTPLVGDLHPRSLPQSYPGFKSAVPEQLANTKPYIVINMGAQAVADLLDRNASSYDDLTVVMVTEPRPLGTAGAIRFARPNLRTDPVLVMNGDSFADTDLCAFVEHHRRAKAKATLLCAEVDNAGRYGRVALDADGRIRGFIEKDPNFHDRSAVSAGVYLFSARLLDEIASSNAASLESEVFGRAPAGSLDAFAGRFAFIDIGTPESLKLAERVFSAEFEDRPA